MALRGDGGALDGPPAGEAGGVPVLGCGEDLFVGQRGEGVEQQRSGGGFAKAGVAVVNGGIHRNLRAGLGAAFGEGAGEFEAAEGADVMLAAAGVSADEFTGTTADKRGPSVIVAGLVGDGFDGLALEAGSGEEEGVAADEHR